MRLALPFALLCACRGVDPAPQDLDGLLHFAWDQAAVGEDTALAEGLVNLHGVLPHDELPIRGAQTRLTTAQIADLGLSGSPDPALANGFFIVTEVDCTLEQVVPVLTALDQDEQYPGSYDGYERVYTSDAAAFEAGEVPTISWDVTIEASPAGFDYVEQIRGVLRRVPGADAVGPAQDFVVQRTWLVEPAAEDDDNRSFDQDYQLDIYYERDPGTLVHAYAIWRQIDLGVLGDQDSDAVIAVTLSESEKWDRRTGELCQGG